MQPTASQLWEAQVKGVVVITPVSTHKALHTTEGARGKGREGGSDYKWRAHQLPGDSPRGGRLMGQEEAKGYPQWD